MRKFLDARDFAIELYAFINSFVTVVLLWTSHHDIFRKVRRTDRRLTLANGSLFFVSAVPYPTSVLGKYLLTDAASAATALRRIQTDLNSKEQCLQNGEREFPESA